MPGFYVSTINMQDTHESTGGERVVESFETDGTFCARCTLNKFMGDKAFGEDDAYVVIAEGVVTNKAELFAESGVYCMMDLIICLYEQCGESFFLGFRGSFSGALYDKAKGKWVFYTNHYGDNALFYHYCEPEGTFVFASQPSWVLGCLKEKGVKLTLDDQAIYSMLTYGFMMDDSTYACEVKRLLPGHYAVLQHGSMKVERYYMPKERRVYTPSLEDEIVEELDRLFRQAVRREFDKDVEYGYQHICDLSGGLDSRMTTWIAHDMGYEPCLNLTYSQSGYIDELVAEQIADYLGNDILFKSLDSASFIYDAERLVSMNAGLSLYSGITGGERMLRLLDLRAYGLEHTGQVGDVVVGSFLRNSAELQDIVHAGMYSDKFMEYMRPIDKNAWADREQYLLFTRGFLGALSTHLIRHNYVDVSSPFLDIDFFDFCMSIPVDLRANHRLYKAWILSHYPKAAQFVWEKQGVSLTASSSEIFVTKVRRKVRNLSLRLVSANTLLAKSSMNPMQYWYQTKPAMREWMDDQMELPHTELDSDLDELLHSLYKVGTALEKIQVITVVHALRFWFN